MYYSGGDTAGISSWLILHGSVLRTLAKVKKGAWRMPWLTEAMKDVISCDKPRLGANDL